MRLHDGRHWIEVEQNLSPAGLVVGRAGFEVVLSVAGMPWASLTAGEAAELSRELDTMAADLRHVLDLPGVRRAVESGQAERSGPPA